MGLANPIQISCYRHFDKLLLYNNKISINLNIGYDNKTEEVLTTKFLGLQINNNLNWKKARRIYYPQTKFSMLCHEDSHSSLENGCFKISLL
jgi:hypothetical protein